jgi:DNA/RNA-binding domain of Phe-tRNA-synthetase-like protein
MLEQILVEDAVYALRPDFAVLLMTAEGLVNGPSETGPADAAHDDPSAGQNASAGDDPRAGQDASAGDDPRAAEDALHVEAWRAAYRRFGVNPKRARPSVDALLRRPELPAINRVVDAYNTVSAGYGLPIGGEDLDTYDGPARLVRATGAEPFGTVRNGEPVTEHPEPGEVIWRDDAGVTCRRWNWRQCIRTHITEHTKNALFILERLEPYPLDRLASAGGRLAAALRSVTPDVVIRSRLIQP